jgi:hypothetical protein
MWITGAAKAAFRDGSAKKYSLCRPGTLLFITFFAEGKSRTAATKLRLGFHYG